MNMKQKVGPGLIVLAVVVLAVVLYGMYRLAFSEQSPPARAEDAPAYAKQRGMVPGSGPASAPMGAPPDQGGRPMYGQGSGYSAGGPASQSGRGGSPFAPR